MIRKLLCAATAFAVAGCATTGERSGSGPTEVRIIAFNDFHGNLQPPNQAISAPVLGQAAPVRVPAGGAAHFATALQRLRAGNPNTVTVAAGDMIGASPLVSSVFLDEPTIIAMNMMHVDYNAVGNHELDRGRAELLRMQRGGCERHTARVPCQLDRFPGARFGFLAANIRTEDGGTLFPPYAIRSFGRGAHRVRVAFIGLTLREAPTLVTPSGVAGLDFADEADTVNALIPRLRAEGADAIVVVIHQGLATTVPYNDHSCGGVTGDLLPILARLDPEVDVVVSGHTHNAYICDYGTIDPSRPFLVTSAGRYGTLLTDIELTVDPERGVLARRADNLIVQGEAFTGTSGTVPVSDRFPVYPPDPAVAALVERYAVASAPLARRVIGRLTGSAPRGASDARESVLGDLIADSQLAATSAADAGGAQIAFMNTTGVRADIVPAPDGSVTFGDIYAAQPFGNSLVVKSFTGRQVRALLEQQFGSGRNTPEHPTMLAPSRGLTYAYDLSRPAGQRILDLRLNGQPIRDDAVYRVTMNNFLATGGDNFTVFRDGTNAMGGPQDLDALERYFAASSPLTPPATDRLVDRTPR